MGLKDHISGLTLGVAAPDGSASPSILTRTDGVTQLVLDNFNQITLENEMKPDKMAPNQRGVYSFGTADAFVAWATQNNMTVHGHSLLFAANNPNPQIPNWMKNFQGNRSQWEVMTDEFITDVVSHFAGTSVVSWDVVNEAFDNNGNRIGTIWQNNIDGAGGDHIADAFFSARAADANATLYYNDYGLIQNTVKLDAVIAMVNDFLGRGTPVPIDGIGFQFHEITEWPPDSTVRAALQKAVDTGLKVKITEIDLRTQYFAQGNSLTAQQEADQGAKYRQNLAAYLDVVPVAQRGGFSVWGVLDTESWFHNNGTEWPLLWNGDLSPKDAYDELNAELLSRATANVSFGVTAPTSGAVGVGSPIVVGGTSPDDGAGAHQFQVLDDTNTVVMADWGGVTVTVNTVNETWLADGSVVIPQGGEAIRVRARRLV